MRARGSTVPLLCSLAIVAGAPAALAGGTSLYSGPGPRPGPDVLYGAPAVAPQLENVGVWSAAPILVPGASAYRGGEFLYQDFLYDDHGAAEVPDPTDPKGGGNLFSKPDGTYTNPTDPAYARSEEHTSNSSHGYISYAVFCLKKKKKEQRADRSHLERNTINGGIGCIGRW